MIKHDTTYNSVWINKWHQLLFKKGKKETAEIYTNDIFKNLKLSYGIHPYYFFNDFIVDHKIVVELRSFRRSNVYYEVPALVAAVRQYAYSLHWITHFIHTIKEALFKSTLYNEFIKFLESKMNNLKKHNLELLHSVTKSRAYQQYRW